MSIRALLHFAPLLVALAVAAVIDVRTRRIPNWLTASVALSGVLSAVVAPWPLSAAAALAGLGVSFVLGVVFLLLGGMGGGDVKLVAAIGAWLGILPSLRLFAIAMVAGMALAIVEGARRGRLTALFGSTANLLMRFYAVRSTDRASAAFAETRSVASGFQSVDRPLPFAVPLLLAAVATLFGMPGMRGLGI